MIPASSTTCCRCPTPQETLARVSAHVDEVQQATGRRMLLENPSTYILFEESTIDEIDFLDAVAERSGCGLLLDVNNVMVSAVNHGLDPFAYVDRFPVERVGEIHLAGYDETDRRPGRTAADRRPWLGRPRRRVRSSTATRSRRTGPVATLIEWDNDVPAFPMLLAEADRAEAVLARRSASGATGGGGLTMDLAATQAAFAAALLDPALPVPAGVTSARGRADASASPSTATTSRSACARRWRAISRWWKGWSVQNSSRHGARLHRAAQARLAADLRLWRRFRRFHRRLRSRPRACPISPTWRGWNAPGSRAYHAADAEPLGIAALAGLGDSDAGRGASFVLHPAAALVRSRFPVGSIWQAHQSEPVGAMTASGGECVLVARPGFDVERPHPAGAGRRLREAAALRARRSARPRRQALPPTPTSISARRWSGWSRSAPFRASHCRRSLRAMSRHCRTLDHPRRRPGRARAPDRELASPRSPRRCRCWRCASRSPCRSSSRA